MKPMMGFFLLWATAPLLAQSKDNPVDKFRQLEEILPTPNIYRTASGAPGHKYWQQRADYRIEVELDDEKQHLYGKETIVYANNSPDRLKYLWLQLDQNRFRTDSDQFMTGTAPSFREEPGDKYTPDLSKMSFNRMDFLLRRGRFEGGHRIDYVRDAAGEPLPFTVVKTMMRVDLPKSLEPGEKVELSIGWNYPIVDQDRLGGRGGFELFKEDGNYLYEIAQWFPRMVAYTDSTGWQHKQFLGGGEFTLEFGDYEVAITVPADHVVAATGVLQNPAETLTAEQRRRLKKAAKADRPVLIVTPEEAEANEKSRLKTRKTWRFKAENVRDFAFASSRKFIWDAQGVKQENGERVMAMSYYPKEGNPLWERYSTHAIIHTIEQYNRYTFVYPYPVAISVNGPVGGMEYPMICFNGPRPEKDGTYSRRTKYGLISVIIHEIGHNYFPMIVNSDERQWTWMDEGLNTFLQFLSEQAWEEQYPSRRGEPRDIVSFMTSSRQMPIMTNSESLQQFGSNAYAKPATALNILRETVLGRELFDFAFREFAQRWMFKRPMPADFFRTMEDASGVDLDWFWRGWFYSTDHVDIAVVGMTQYQFESGNPDEIQPKLRERNKAEPMTAAEENNQGMPRRVDRYPELLDFYNENDVYAVTPSDRKRFKSFMEGLEDDQREVMGTGLNLYVVDFENIGGLMMPIIIEVAYVDGTKETMVFPAEIWRYNHREVSKLLMVEKEIASIQIDPRQETADADQGNNFFPPRAAPSRFQLFKSRVKKPNLMQKMKDEPKEKAETDGVGQ